MITRFRKEARDDFIRRYGKDALADVHVGAFSGEGEAWHCDRCAVTIYLMDRCCDLVKKDVVYLCPLCALALCDDLDKKQRTILETVVQQENGRCTNI